MIILTDLSDVLIGGLSDAARIIGEKYGAGTSAKCLKRIQETQDGFNAVLRGQMKEADYYRVFFAGCHFCFGYNDMNRVFSEAFKISVPGTLKLYQRIISHPSSLAPDASTQFGMPAIFIASDHISERIPEIKRLHPEIFRVVTDAFWSCEFYSLKSDPGFFSRLLSLTFCDMNPQEFIFVDDNQKNVEAAERVGIKAIRFTDAVSLEAALRNLGFVIASPTP